MTTNTRYRGISAQRGFGAIMAIIVLVILASLAAGLVTLGTGQQLNSAGDLLSARALAAARAGTDVGLFKALSSTTPSDTWKSCSSLSQLIDLRTTTGFQVNVTCNSWTYYDGYCDSTDSSSYCVSNPNYPATDPNPKVRQVRLFRIEATACNSSSTCPDATMATSPGYIERVRQVTATN